MDCLPEMLKALADETRFEIIRLLLTHDYCVGALAKHLGISEAAVSQHLQILRKAGLAKPEKRSYWTHYSIDKERLGQVADALKAVAVQEVTQQPACPRMSDTNQACDGRRDSDMCKCKPMPKCAHPERLEGRKPGECSPEQIRECHGDPKEHPCKEKEEE